MGFYAKRILEVALASRPQFYLKVLSLLRRGSLEKRIYLSLLQRGDVVFDLGANEGYFTSLFSDIVGAGGQVHAFEPVPQTFEKLSARMSMRPRNQNYLLNQVACSDCSGDGTVSVPGGDSGQASLRQHKGGSWNQSVVVSSFPVKLVTLNDYVRGNSLSRLDFVKCDVEGAELLALRGGRVVLEQFGPLILFELFQLWTADFGHTPADVIQFLKSCGYNRFFVAGEHLERLDDAKDGINEIAAVRSVNVLAAISGKHDARIRRLDILS